jgi:uncharacterized membrane protein
MSRAARRGHAATMIGSPPALHAPSCPRQRALADTARNARRRALWALRIPLGLVVLGLLPALGGALRLVDIGSGRPSLPDAERFAAHPAVLVVHIVASLTFALLGAAQFWPSLRQRRRSLHRAAGYLLVPAGFASGLSGLATMAVYEAAPTSGLPIHLLRIAAGVAMMSTLALGVAAIVRGDVGAHGAWMTRAYALGIAPGAQALMLAPLTLVLGVDTEATFTVGMAAGWLVSVLVGERAIRRRTHSSEC